MTLMAPKIPREDFMRKVVLPYFWGSHEKEDNYIILFDLAGRILYCNKPYAALYGSDSLEEYYGKPYAALAEAYRVPFEIVSKLENIRNQVVNQQKTIRFIYFANNDFVTGAYLNYHFPVFYSDGSVFCTAVRFGEYMMMPKTSILNMGNTKQPIPAKPVPKITLTKRQHEVLFLLSTAFPQEEIATMLGITRGTISRCIASLCQKFEIIGQNTALLIDKAAKMKLLSKIPQSLIQAGIMQLDAFEK